MLPTTTAIAIIIIGTWLRLHRLDAIEFKRDEQEALNLSIQFLTDRPWSSSNPWPTHGMLSSNGVPNTPLFIWVIAALWAPTHDPLAVTGAIALMNALCLYPLWRWARRRVGESRALLILAVCAVSPFAVIFSRKIWTQDLLLPGVLALLWGVEWLYSARPWLGVALLATGALVVGQLHQSGAIGILLLPAAIALQTMLGAGDDRRIRLGPGSVGDIGALVVAIGMNLFFWLPYLRYLAQLPSPLLAGRPSVNAFTPFLLLTAPRSFPLICSTSSIRIATISCAVPLAPPATTHPSRSACPWPSMGCGDGCDRRRRCRYLACGGGR